MAAGDGGSAVQDVGSGGARWNVRQCPTLLLQCEQGELTLDLLKQALQRCSELGRGHERAKSLLQDSSAGELGVSQKVGHCGLLLWVH